MLNRPIPTESELFPQPSDEEEKVISFKLGHNEPILLLKEKAKRRPSYKISSEELEDIEPNNCQEPFSGVRIVIPSNVKRYRYQFTSKEIEEFGPDFRR